MDDVDKILEERRETHGSFQTHAEISQRLKDCMREYDIFHELDHDQAEALEMIQHKIARILNGNPNEPDHWLDIAGYAKLVHNRLKDGERRA